MRVIEEGKLVLVMKAYCVCVCVCVRVCVCVCVWCNHFRYKWKVKGDSVEDDGTLKSLKERFICKINCLFCDP